MDWVAGLIGIIAKIVVGCKNKWGWIIYIISEFAWIVVGLYSKLYGLVTISSLVAIIYVYNFIKWWKEDAKR